MNIDVDTLTHPLSKYAPTVNDYVNLMVGQMRKLALILLAIFFLIEMADWRERFKRDGGMITIQFLGEITVKYLLALIFIMFSTHFINAVQWFFGRGISLIDSMTEKAGYDMKFDAGDAGGIEGIILGLIGGVVYDIAGMVSNILIFVLYLNLYLLKGIAPLALSFFMSDAWRPVSFNWSKLFLVLNFQGILILMISRIYPLFVTDDLLKLSEGTASVWAVAVSSILKGIIFIYVLMGANRWSSRLIGV